jgi:hypothetical protein
MAPAASSRLIAHRSTVRKSGHSLVSIGHLVQGESACPMVCSSGGSAGPLCQTRLKIQALADAVKDSLKKEERYLGRKKKDISEIA